MPEVCTLEALLAPAAHDDEPRPRIESHDSYVIGILLLAVAEGEQDAQLAFYGWRKWI